MSNFQPLEVVDRGSETQLQVADNLNKLTQQDNTSKIKPDMNQQYLKIFNPRFVKSG